MKFYYLLFFLYTISFNSYPKTKDLEKNFVKGADVGWITEMEVGGCDFFDKDNREVEGLSLLKSLGCNTVRLRVWVNPKEKWNGLEDVLDKAKRADSLGMRIMINFHFSDSWADPQQQRKPVVWTDLSFEELKYAVAQDITAVLSALKVCNIEPEWVQVGNETGNGMIWPEGKVDVSFENYAILNNVGYDAVKSVLPDALVIVHLQGGENNQLYRAFFDGLKKWGGKWDMIGLSVYPFWAKMDWPEANLAALANMQDLIVRYGTPIIVCEAGYEWNKPEEAKLYLEDLIAKVKSLPDKMGQGVIYWEPLCYNSWKGYNMGAFDNSGKPTIALEAFK